MAPEPPKTTGTSGSGSTDCTEMLSAALVISTGVEEFSPPWMRSLCAGAEDDDDLCAQLPSSDSPTSELEAAISEALGSVEDAANLLGTAA